MSDLADKLSKAIEDKKNDINSWIWSNSNGSTVRLLDMNNDELQKAYNHTTDMLWNNGPYQIGKYNVRKNIQKTYVSCNAELFHRYIIHDLNIDGLKTNKDLLDFINSHKESNGIKNTDSITVLFGGVPTIYENLTVGDLLNSCLDTLEPINRKLISDKFILSLGIWLTEDEKKELTEFDEKGKLRNRLIVMKERLFLNDIRFRIHPNGLSYNELRSLILLEGRLKVSTVPSQTLRLLRDKVLLLLDNDLDYHINLWNEMKSHIEKVADYKGYVLKLKKY